MPWKAGELCLKISQNFFCVFYRNFHFREVITKAFLQDSFPKFLDIHLELTQDRVLSHGSAVWMSFPNLFRKVKVNFYQRLPEVT